MKADLTNVFKEWFEVAATPIDMAANAVKQYTQGHIQPFVDEAAKSLHKQTETINTNHPGLIHAVTQNLSDFKDKIEEAADTTVDYAKRDHVPAFDLDDIPGYDYLPAADNIPGVQKVKQMTGIETKENQHHKKTLKGGRRKRRKSKKIIKIPNAIIGDKGEVAKWKQKYDWLPKDHPPGTDLHFDKNMDVNKIIRTLKRRRVKSIFAHCSTDKCKNDEIIKDILFDKYITQRKDNLFDEFMQKKKITFIFKPSPFPYMAPKGVHHYLLWALGPKGTYYETNKKEVESEIKSALYKLTEGKPTEFIWYANKKKSIKGVQHYQVYWHYVKKKRHKKKTKKRALKKEHRRRKRKSRRHRRH